jgi:hypothetical protein
MALEVVIATRRKTFRRWKKENQDFQEVKNLYQGILIQGLVTFVPETRRR